MIEIGKILNKQWKITGQLNSGGQGTVFEAINIKDGTPIAVKVVKESIDPKAFEREITAYLHISEQYNNEHQPIIPDFHGFGISDAGPNVMIMELMGPDLHDLWNTKGRHCSTGMLICLYKEVLIRLERLHKTGMAHRDIKPENICSGKDDSDDIDVRLVDLGMCAPFLCSETGRHIPLKYGDFVGGTVLYCSSNQHDGGSPTRKDDLEALCYTMMKLYNGYLPWSGSVTPDMPIWKQHELVAISKKRDAEAICDSYPQFFQKTLKYVKSLVHNDDPNYEHMQQILDEALLHYENIE